MGGWKEVDWIKIPDTELAMIRKGTGSWGEGIYALCARKGCTVTQALLGFFAVQGFPMLPLAGADDESQLLELTEAMRMEFDGKD